MRIGHYSGLKLSPIFNHMKTPFATTVRSLKKVMNRFDEPGLRQKHECLTQLAGVRLEADKTLLTCFDVLLFVCAHPDNSKILSMAEKLLSRISNLIRNSPNKSLPLFVNSGLPFTPVITRYSHDFVQWLLAHPSCRTEITGFENPTLQLNDVLRLTLPSLEISETTAGLSNEGLLEALKISKQQQLPFLIEQLGTLDYMPYIKDLLFDRLDLFIKLIPRDQSFSRAYNRLVPTSIFFHDSLQRNFDHEALFEKPLPSPLSLDVPHRDHVIDIIRNSMALTDRETDPTTYLDPGSLRLYQLERGVTIALYTMLPGRQLPLESYVGYTLFKNGFPACYGGGWVFGMRSHFGINIFESFRGGESGMMMCQLLRVYHQAFGIQYFEVEPYQFGQDNPEAIQSGAFWYYYRFGFRPMDKKLLAIATQEHRKIRTKPGHRTPEKILKKFTAGNIALKLGKVKHATVSAITIKTTGMVHNLYHDSRLEAERDCIRQFLAKAGLKENVDGSALTVLKEVALWAAAFHINDKRRLDLMTQMITTKPVDLYRYQKLLREFFDDSR